MDEQLTKKERRQMSREQKQTEQDSLRKKKARKKITNWGIVLVIAGLIIWGLVAGGDSPEGDNSVHDNSPVSAVTADDWVKGPEDASVTLIEYSDFQCPACASYHPILTLLANEFQNNLKFVYRHFPIENIHSNARLAAQAAEAAGMQGKFWEMHDEIFENQNEWENKRNSDARDEFVKYAEGLELNIEQFEADMDGDIADDSINTDLASARTAQVNSTPSFFLNGERISQNPRSYEDFKSLIEVAIAEAEAEPEVQAKAVGPDGQEIDIQVEAVPSGEQGE